MRGSRIYTDFSDEIQWIRESVSSDVSSLPVKLRPLAGFYTGGRLKIIPSTDGFRLTDPRMGRPVPYAAFWFADALGLSQGRLRRLSGLSLVYSSLATTLKDDIEDAVPGNDEARAMLAQFWDQKYLGVLEEIFASPGAFRRSTTWVDDQWRRYRAWRETPLGDLSRRAFSQSFLRESSRYFVAVVLPTLSAIASSAGMESRAPEIKSFLMSFSAGWRVFDDLMDWEKDISAKDLNRSSVLTYIRDRTGGRGTLDENTLLSWFMSSEFIGEAYGTMLRHLRRAREIAAGFGSPYLDAFMDQQVTFQSEKERELLKSASQMMTALNGGLASVLSRAQVPTGPRQ